MCVQVYRHFYHWTIVFELAL